jgi:PAP2 superfamily protein
VTLPPCFILIGWSVIEALKFLTLHTPTTCDVMLWRLDGLLGFEPSIVAMAIASTIPGLWEVLKISYHQGLLVAMALAAVADAGPWRFVAKVAVATALGYALFWVVPACGPSFFLYGPAGTPRNAMPSLHMVWAIFVRGRVGGKGVGARLAADVFIILTVLSTLGLGEHYLVDLVAAVPFWLAFEALWRWRGFSKRAGANSVGVKAEALPPS